MLTDFLLKAIFSFCIFQLIFVATKGLSIRIFSGPGLKKILTILFGLLGVSAGMYSGSVYFGMLFLGCDASLLSALSSLKLDPVGSLGYLFFLCVTFVFWGVSAIGLTRWIFSTDMKKMYLKALLIMMCFYTFSFFFFPSILNKLPGAVLDNPISGIIFFFFTVSVPAAGGFWLGGIFAKRLFNNSNIDDLALPIPLKPRRFGRVAMLWGLLFLLIIGVPLLTFKIFSPPRPPTLTPQEQHFQTLESNIEDSLIYNHIDDNAGKNATELLVLAPHFQNNFVYPDAIHHANVVLGRIAVREGNIEKAKQYLLAAGRSPGSAVMDSFGPNMSLAKDLLEKGERDTVLQYFELCHKFWKDDNGQLDKWSNEVKMGQIPDFGANLAY